MFFRKVTLGLLLFTHCVISNAYEWAEDADNLAAMTAIAYAASDLIGEQLKNIEGNDALQKASISLDVSNSQTFDAYPTSNIKLNGQIPVLSSSFLEGFYSRKKAFFTSEGEAFYGTKTASLSAKKEIGFGTKINEKTTIKFSHSKNTDEEPVNFFGPFFPDPSNDSKYDRNSVSFIYENDLLKIDADYSQAEGKRTISDIWLENGILLSNSYKNLTLGILGSHNYNDDRKKVRLTLKPNDSIRLWAEKSKTDYQQHVQIYTLSNSISLGCNLFTLIQCTQTWTPTGNYTTYDFSYEITSYGADYKITPEWEVNLEHLSTERIPANYLSTSYKLNKKAELSLSYDSYNEFLGTGFKIKFN